MKKFFARLFRRDGLLRFDLLSASQPTYPDPDKISAGELVIVDDAGIMKWACLQCPGGCAVIISLSLNQQRRPRWQVLTDF